MWAVLQAWDRPLAAAAPGFPEKGWVVRAVAHVTWSPAHMVTSRLISGTSRCLSQPHVAHVCLLTRAKGFKVWVQGQTARVQRSAAHFSIRKGPWPLGSQCECWLCPHYQH